MTLVRVILDRKTVITESVEALIYRYIDHAEMLCGRFLTNEGESMSCDIPEGSEVFLELVRVGLWSYRAPRVSRGYVCLVREGAERTFRISRNVVKAENLEYKGLW